MEVEKQMLEKIKDYNRFCSHILNVHSYTNPKIQDFPVHKGNLFLGGVSAFHEKIINECRITVVLSILDEHMFKHYRIKQKVEHLKIMKHKWIDLEDEEDQKISPFFKETYQFIKQALKENNLLIHCQLGISRSATILIAYLMKQYKLKYQPAFQLVLKKRKIICPNDGFKKELLEFEKKNYC